ncbi:MAG: SIR2 family protein [Candidatus Aminicenantes bacterium]|nr:MAG: SIR2 family protein [Candidatus Aminicenantes bacterium]
MSGNIISNESSNGIGELIKIFKRRIDNIAGRSLKRFSELYREHPGFKGDDVPLPFLDADQKRAEKSTEDLDKIVFLLGAGTSKSAGLPLASEIVKHCEIALGKKLLIDEINAIRDKHAEEEKKEEKVILFRETVQKDEYTFEEVLSAYRKILGDHEAIQLLKANYFVKERDFPQKTLITLFNECLAHLAREHLVDFIVNFNFDELLEHSLKEDIGPHSYVRVSSPATFRWAVTHGLTDSKNQVYSEPDQRTTEMGCESAKVWLLKPHGTISHENTLRHLIEQVWKFETEKEDCLKRVFKNSYVVVVGYSLSAADLHRILITHAFSGSIKGLFWGNTGKMRKGLGKDLKKVMKKIVGKDSFFHIKMKADRFALKLFNELYSTGNLEELNESGLLPPFRHFLRAFVFQQKKGIKCTFVNRFIAELISHCIRMKGWFSSRTIDKCHQIRHLLDSATQTQKNKLSNLPDQLEPFFKSITRKDRAERLFILRKKFKNRRGSNIEDEFIRMIEHCIPTDMKWSKRKHFAVKLNVKNREWAAQASKMASQLKDHHDVSAYQYHSEIATFKNLLIIPNKPVLDALTKWLFSKEKNLYNVSECCALINNFEGIDIKQFSGIGFGDYDEEKKEILEKLNNESEKEADLYLNDIEECIRNINEINEKLKKHAPTIHYLPIHTHKKRFHFNFWHDEENYRVFGIIFNRIDRQAGTTFNWIKLDLKDPIEESQFDAYKHGYLKMPEEEDKKKFSDANKKPLSAGL